MFPRLIAFLILASCGSLMAAPAASSGTPRSPNRAAVYALANRCFALRALRSRRFIAAAGPTGYTASAVGRAGAMPFYLKPTGLGTYLLYDVQRRLVTAAGFQGVTRAMTAGPRGEFAIEPVRVGAIKGLSLRLRFGFRRLVVSSAGGPLTLGAALRSDAIFAMVARPGCTPFPEAQVDVTVHGHGRRTLHGRIFGFVDDHVHVTGNMRGGGDVISGEPYDRFGIAAALGQDQKIHGVDGKLDVTGNLLRSGSPLGTHDTHGWPSFKGWPTADSMTHQQAYYVWIERAWRAGMRMMVAQTADDQPLCRLEPRRRARSCSETASVLAQIRVLKGLQSYVDAQSGGPGRGWFRLVYTPAQARRVMEAGKLAVLIGIESSDLFGCSDRAGRPQCTRADIDRGLARYKRLGVRGMFVAHWVDNAFAGAAFEGGAKGIFINILNRFQTGSYFTTATCPGAAQGVHMATLPLSLLKALASFFPAAASLAARAMPIYPSGLRCNARGLTPLGRYLIRRLMANHMLIEVDHLSEIARDQVLSIAARADYPLVSSHNGTGGEWTSPELVRLFKLGGFAAVTPAFAPELAAKILAMARLHRGHGFDGVGLGTDTNGFASLPGPRPDAAVSPLRYPFRSYDGSVTFTRERTGMRTFDLNSDGVAHYGLIADLIADTQRTHAGRRALRFLFDSAQAYLDTWQQAFTHR